MNPVVQEETTGCAIAASAALAGTSYRQAKQTANRLGIYADDQSLWSDTQHIRRLLLELGVHTSPEETPFKSWEILPDMALLAIKWHKEGDQAFWHWVVFIREGDDAYILDSKRTLKNHIRRDFGRIKPKWFIEVNTSNESSLDLGNFSVSQ